MYYLYLDESGDLGLNLQRPGTTPYFVIMVMEVTSDADRKAIEKAITRTIKNKNQKKSSGRHRPIAEIKGTETDLADKKYFYRHVVAIPFRLYTLILDKLRYRDQLLKNKDRVYNFLTHLTLKELPLEQASTRIALHLDRSKRKLAIREFNAYMFKQLEGRIPPHVPLDIHHDSSQENKPLQAVDLFAWGVHRKYARGEMQWYDCFKEKIAYETLYPPK
ncbi:DUF3800 domain-containing protein [candidate division KSB1 bacterium]|nr:DUF3800 domain-containing protein [candidate division KSB1 bacterium]